MEKGLGVEAFFRYRLQAASHKPIAECRQLIADCSPLKAYSLLPKAFCLKRNTSPPPAIVLRLAFRMICFFINFVL
jgi:hypothetical protein